LSAFDTAAPPALLVVTDLDGCLLDEETYGYDAARPALAEMSARGVRLLLASSKTRAEMEPLARDLDVTAGLIVENGGALLVPAGELACPPRDASLVRGYWTMVLGDRRAHLVRALGLIASEVGAFVRSFATMSRDDVVRLTALEAAAADRAREREYDEPFLLENEERAEALGAAARARGLQVTRGGRFWHLTGASDKARALWHYLALQAGAGRRFFVVALGDAPNDLPLLRAADRPIVIPRPEGPDPLLLKEMPGAERAPAAGPGGWNAAILGVLRGERLPLLWDREA
jgi:mannosyl-3-phosphoglycerate phosphatase